MSRLFLFQRKGAKWQWRREKNRVVFCAPASLRLCVKSPFLLQSPAMATAFVIHPDDNVATLLDDAGAGPIHLTGASAQDTLTARDPIPHGHKMATRDVPQGRAILKYGIRIGHATGNIRAGEWVHLHNMASDFDERAATLDVTTGAPTDTRYE